MKLLDRRQPSDHAAGDRITKQAIVGTVCGIGLITAATICRLAIESAPIPDQLDNLATLIVGALIGWIGKTSVDAVRGATEPQVVTTNPADPLDVVEAEPPNEGEPEPPAVTKPKRGKP